MDSSFIVYMEGNHRGRASSPPGVDARAGDVSSEGVGDAFRGPDVGDDVVEIHPTQAIEFARFAVFAGQIDGGVVGGVARDAVDAGPVKETKLESLTSESALGEPGAFVHAITVPIVLGKSADETHETDVAVILAGGRAHARLLEEFARGRRLDGFALFDAPLRHVPRSFAIASLAAQHLSSIVEHDRRRAPSVSFTVHRHASTLGIPARLLLCLVFVFVVFVSPSSSPSFDPEDANVRVVSSPNDAPRPRRYGALARVLILARANHRHRLASTRARRATHRAGAPTPRRACDDDARRRVSTRVEDASRRVDVSRSKREWIHSFTHREDD